jgi:hypothetical protein
MKMIAPMLGRNDRDQEGVGVPRLFAGNRGGASRQAVARDREADLSSKLYSRALT